MILKGSQRGGGANLAAHLTNTRENDHVDIAEIRGLAGDDLRSAFAEIEATAQGTRATQPFFPCRLIRRRVLISPAPILHAALPPLRTRWASSISPAP